jgi:hypothetical protein
MYNSTLDIQSIKNIYLLLAHQLINLNMPELPKLQNNRFVKDYVCEELNDTINTYKQISLTNNTLMTNLNNKDVEIATLQMANNSANSRLNEIQNNTYLNQNIKDKCMPMCADVNIEKTMYSQNVNNNCKKAILNYCKENPTAIGCICSNPEYKNIPDCIKLNSFLDGGKQKVLKVKCPTPDMSQYIKRDQAFY